jgi:acetyl esterase/lipase
MRMIRLFVGVGLVLSCGYAAAFSAETKYVTKTDISYVDEAARLSDEYIKERCVLDIYYPEGVTGYSTIVWFHGGGLKNGNKSVLEGFKNKGLAVVAVNYRLYPKVKAPVYIEDAAASVAWVFENIETFGGDASRIFVSGSSAGGYLTSMVGLDKGWLAAHGIDANRIAGLIPLAGHTITHFTVRAERGIEGTRPIIDDLAPLYHVRSDAPPVLLITGDRELEMLGRYEENAYMMRMMKVAGHKDTRIFELDGYGHSPKDAAAPLIVKEVKRIEKMLKR